MAYTKQPLDKSQRLSTAAVQNHVKRTEEIGDEQNDTLNLSNHLKMKDGDDVKKNIDTSLMRKLSQEDNSVGDEMWDGNNKSLPLDEFPK